MPQHVGPSKAAVQADGGVGPANAPSDQFLTRRRCQLGAKPQEQLPMRAGGPSAAQVCRHSNSHAAGKSCALGMRIRRSLYEGAVSFARPSPRQFLSALQKALNLRLQL